MPLRMKKFLRNSLGRGVHVSGGGPLAQSMLGGFTPISCNAVTTTLALISPRTLKDEITKWKRVIAIGKIDKI